MQYKSVHGGDIYNWQGDHNRLLDFSANINPLGLPKSVKSAIKKSLDNCINYPDPYCRVLSKILAEKLGVDKAWLYLGNGAADVLFKLAY